ncbi:hypothetical protein SAMN05444422_101473 [Halobiforma haloterrestris]|uniref:Uncharacterized protein n=1 Tax=Natronobacterium haloterrestre TaxID=148448 RepID=A0A1I1DB76_NATHA|nr:hypothetical protein [Halobiforma haloterrestris]SFB72181.1 hypothetical protein SAMN05444422_101473 [Halobiforma haloterrestris]
MTWKVIIQGDQEDLRLLERTFNDDPKIIHDEAENRFYLKSRAFEDLTTASEVWSQAQNIVKTLCGILELNHGLFEDITTGAVYEVDNGKSVTIKTDTVQMHGAPELREELGLPEPDVFDEEILLALKSDDDAVQELLLLWERGDSWANLYKILEFIEEELSEDVDEAGWISSSNRKNFRRTANDKKIIGLDARHASTEGRSSPTQPMSHSDARSLIHSVSIKWLEQKSNEGDS